MIVYMVKAEDPYVDRDGSSNPPSHFGPWLNQGDAEKAKAHLEQQEQGGYTIGTKMAAYENIEVYPVKVLHDFLESQVW